MTVATQVNRVESPGNGSATTFSFSPMIITEASDLVVTLVNTVTAVETTLSEGTGGSAYAVNVSTYPGTGSITYPENAVTPISSSYKIVITRAIPHIQDTDLENQGGYFAETQEAALDRIVLQIQDLQEAVNRSLKSSVGSSGDPSALVADLDAAVTAAANSATTASGFADDAEASATAAALSADEAELAATSVELPIAVADTWLRRNSANTAYETKTDSELATLIQAFLFTTGDIKPTIKTTADSGWVLLNDGTIGNASSGATTRANADTSALFTLLWNNISNTYAAVSGGRGANAAADFAANKTIALPKALGRVLGASGAGAGLTSRSLGETLGAETAVADLFPHTHGAGSLSASAQTATLYINNSGPGDTTSHAGIGASGAISRFPSGLSDRGTAAYTDVVTVSTATITGSTGSSGDGAGHANMQPSLFINYMIKL